MYRKEVQEETQKMMGEASVIRSCLGKKAFPIIKAEKRRKGNPTFLGLHAQPDLPKPKFQCFRGAYGGGAYSFGGRGGKVITVTNLTIVVRVHFRDVCQTRGTHRRFSMYRE